MAAKLVVVASVLAACSAGPVWYSANNAFYPEPLWREARSPSFSYGFGSGFSSDIAGVKQSSSLGASFRSGEGEAYGSGLAGDNSLARGIGYANTGSQYPVYQQRYVPAYQPRYVPYYPRNYGYGAGSASAVAQNFGYGSSAASTAQNGGSLGYSGFNGYNGASSIARNTGFGSTASSANSGLGGGSASAVTNDGYGPNVSSARVAGSGYGQAVSAVESDGNSRVSTAQTTQQDGNAVQQTGAFSIDAPGLQATQSHSIKTY